MSQASQVYVRTLGYEDTTTLHPVGVAVLLVLVAWTFLARRRDGLLPFVVLACFVPTAQRVVVAGLDFNFLRILVLAAWARMLARGELASLRLGLQDKLIVAWVFSGLVAYTLLHGSFSAFVNRAGLTYDILGLYLYLRCTVRGWSDLERPLRLVAWLAVPSVVFFVLERTTGRNLFHVFGGVPELTLVRDGKVRAQGPFSHPILAGCFWAALLPLVASLWWMRRDWRPTVVVGTVCILVIVLMTNSSTPVGGVAATLGAAWLWTFRAYLPWILRLSAVMLVLLHLVMEAPVWHLIARIDFAGGSTGWHRYLLIDSAVRHFSDWALIGIRSTDHWGPNMGDLANQYVFVAMRGGLLTLVFFVSALVVAFRGVGRVLRASRGDRRHHKPAWALGVSLAASCAMFIAIAITYAPQNLTAFLLLLAAIRGIDEQGMRRRREARARRRGAAAPPRPVLALTGPDPEPTPGT